MCTKESTIVSKNLKITMFRGKKKWSKKDVCIVVMQLNLQWQRQEWGIGGLEGIPKRQQVAFRGLAMMVGLHMPQSVKWDSWNACKTLCVTCASYNIRKRWCCDLMNGWVLPLDQLPVALTFVIASYKISCWFFYKIFL